MTKYLTEYEYIMREERPQGLYNYTQILDPDTNAFTTMLAMIGGHMPTKRIPWSPWISKGELLRDEGGKLWYVSNIERVNPDDWFSDEKVAVLRQPWGPFKEMSQKISWLEDEVFPRFPV